jgi:hypothetical protein
MQPNQIEQGRGSLTYKTQAEEGLRGVDPQCDNTVERNFGRLKQWRGVATRYDKYAMTFLRGVVLCAAVLRSLHHSHLPATKTKSDPVQETRFDRTGPDHGGNGRGNPRQSERWGLVLFADSEYCFVFSESAADLPDAASGFVGGCSALLGNGRWVLAFGDVLLPPRFRGVIDRGHPFAPPHGMHGGG